MALMKKKEKERMEELGKAEIPPGGLQLGAPSSEGGAHGLWMRQGGEGPEGNQLFYHVFSTNDQFGLTKTRVSEMEDQKMTFGLSLPSGVNSDSGGFGEGCVRGGGGAGTLLNSAVTHPPAVEDMDVQKLDEINAFRQAEASRIISLFNQNPSPEVRHMVGAAHETLSTGGGVFGWASHPQHHQEGVAESGPESIGLSSSSGKETDALFAEAYPGSGDERVRGASSVLTWLQSGLPLERLGSAYGFSDSGSSQGGGGESTHAGSMFNSFLGGAQKPLEVSEGSKHGGEALGTSRGFGNPESIHGSNSGAGTSKGTVFEASQGLNSQGLTSQGLSSQGVSSQGSTHMPSMEGFMAGLGNDRTAAVKRGFGPSLSTGAVHNPPRGFGIQSFSDGGLLGRRTFKPDLRGWEFGVQNNSGLGANPGTAGKRTPGGLGSLRKLQERQWQEAQQNRASDDVSMLDPVQSMSSPILLADDSASEMAPQGTPQGERAQGFARGYMQPFIAGRLREDGDPSAASRLAFSEAPRRFDFPDQDSDPETSTFAGSVLTQNGVGEDESVRGGNAFHTREFLGAQALNHLMLKDEPAQPRNPAAAFVTSILMDSPALAPLPKSLEGLGPDDLGPDLERGTFSGMMASIINNNSPQLAVQFPPTSVGMHKLDLPEPGSGNVLGHEGFDPNADIGGQLDMGRTPSREA
jgi:hypothetical protein